MMRQYLCGVFKFHTNAALRRMLFCVALSWLYAACSQIIIPLPFGLVPLSVQPLPVFFATLLFGWPAVQACFLYLLQGALGAPFFAFGLGGVARLLGPTGGYLIGFLLGASVIAALRGCVAPRSRALIVVLLLASAVQMSAGLLQLSFFVPAVSLFSVGLYPFVLGESIKIMVLYFLRSR